MTSFCLGNAFRAACVAVTAGMAGAQLAAGQPKMACVAGLGAAAMVLLAGRAQP